MRQQESTIDCRPSLLTTDIVDDQEDPDSLSTLLRDELARDDIDDVSEVVDSKSTADMVTADVEMVPVGASNVGAASGIAVSLSSSVSASCDAANVTSQQSRSSPLKSSQNIAADPQLKEIFSAESENVLSASMDQLSTAASCSVIVPPSRSFDSTSSTVVTSTTASSRTEPAQTSQPPRGRITTTSTSKMAAAVQPLAKKGLTHLLNSSSALFHRRRQLQTDLDTKSLSVGYSGSAMSLSSASSKSTSPSEPSASLTEADSESQTIDLNVVPVVCDDVTFLMVKDDFCQKPTDLSAVDKTEDLSSSLSYKDTCLTSKTSASSLSEVLAANEKTASDTVAVGSCQVLPFCQKCNVVKVKAPDIYILPFTGKPERQWFTI